MFTLSLRVKDCFTTVRRNHTSTSAAQLDMLFEENLSQNETRNRAVMQLYALYRLESSRLFEGLFKQTFTLLLCCSLIP